MKFLVGVAMLLAVAPLGLPFENTWFAGFVTGVTFCGFFVAAVVSMPEPTEQSSPQYVWLYRFGHSVFHLGTAYFAHPSVWRYFKDPRGDRRADGMPSAADRELFEQWKRERASSEGEALETS